MHGREEERKVYRVWLERLKEGDHSEDQGIAGKMEPE
jgi:hypothetical protein